MKRSGYSSRIVLIGIIILFGFGFLIHHLYYVQVIRHKELYSKAKRKYTTVKKVKGTRGEIFDKNGYLLVGNLPSINIKANPQLVGGRDDCIALAGFFSRKLDIPTERIFKRLNTKEVNGRKRYEVTIKNNIPLDKAEEIKKELKDRGVKGIYYYDGSVRYYPKDTLLSNILGFVNQDGEKVTPVMGLEEAYNSVLAPVKMKKSVYERTRKGVPLYYGNQKIATVQSGKNIYLTVLEPIQEIVEEELDKVMEKWTPKAAYAVMVDPKTGNIMAIAQRPSFNPNDRSKMKPDSWRNRIASDGFEPGSIMKPLVIAQALSLGLVNPETKIDCENGYWIYGKRSLKDDHSFGDLTVSQIIQKSSNIGTAKITLKLGEKRLYDLLVAYGFGQKTTLPFKYQATGILRKLNRWDTLSITRFPIGQGVLTSPLQLLSAYTVLGNKGKRMDLRIIDQIENSDTGQKYKFPVRVAEQVIDDPRAIKETVDMMKTVTERGGTAVTADVPGYEVAGKTGTAQKWIDGAYSRRKYVASFIGFVPADNPAFILLIAVDEPHGSIYGTRVAAPSFATISKKTLRYLDIPPDYDLKKSAK